MRSRKRKFAALFIVALLALPAMGSEASAHTKRSRRATASKSYRSSLVCVRWRKRKCVKWVRRRRLVAARQQAAPPPPASPRDVSAYRGLGTWVDVYDFSPEFQGGGAPPISPDSVDRMADLGVRTLYLQAAKVDPRSSGDLANPEILSGFLQRAHARGMRVVGWYLPRFGDLEGDVRRLLAVRNFDAGGHRFDGVAVDIEFRADVPDAGLRSQRLVELSRRLRDGSGSDALGAIVMPPVATDVINPAFWPGFPWNEIAAVYDVWLPMSYWTSRIPETGYRDSHRYTSENISRLRAHIGRADAPVHPIGGTAAGSSLDDYRGMLNAASSSGAIGASSYDFRTTAEDAWPVLREAPQ